MANAEKKCSCGTGCEISCDGGCVCIRWEDGTCDSWCEGRVPVSGALTRTPGSDTRLSFCAQDMPLRDIATVFDLMVPEKVAHSPDAFDRRVSLSLEQTTLGELFDALGFGRR